MGGKSKPVISQPLIAPNSAPMPHAKTNKPANGTPGQPRATNAHTMPVNAKLDATDKSTPRVNNTSIWPKAKINKIEVSLPMSNALRKLQNTGARQPTATTMATKISANKHSR